MSLQGAPFNPQHWGDRESVCSEVGGSWGCPARQPISKHMPQSP